MKSLISIAWQSLCVISIADFAAGIVHWIEDAYIRETTPFIGSTIGRANVIHHHLPRHMARKTWWQSSWDLCLFALAVILIAAVSGHLTWHVWLFAIISANANQVHKWAHRTRRENGPIITFLQHTRLILTPKEHAIHHTAPKNVRYCPITNILNPILDTIRFWAALEWLLALTIRLHRQPDTSLPGHGPVPNWIAELRTRSAVKSE